MYKNKTVALALGGGGTCGFAHIGVLKALEDNGIIPDYICGTSMGSIVGSLYADGFTTEQMLHECRKIKFFKIFDPSPNILVNNYIVSGKLVEKFLKKITQEKNIEDLKTKFSCIAVDLREGKEYEFTSGPVWQAVRASISIPVVFKPVEIDNMILVDGGVLNNVPIEPLKKYNPDIVIACDVLDEYTLYNEPKRIWDIMFYAFNVLQNKMEKQKLKHIKYKITPNTTAVSPFSPTLKPLNQLLEEGYNSALKVINKIKKEHK